MGAHNNISDYFDFSKLNNLTPAKGRVLISEPFVNDDYFTKSVILLCDYKDEGAFGFVLNNYIDQPINEVIDDFSDFDTKISIGGPVETNLLFFIHTRPDVIDDSIEILPGLFMGGQFSQIKELVEAGELKNNEIKFFLGYSGWDKGQLDDEIASNSWFVANVSTDTLMNYHGDDIWQKLLESMGAKHKVIATFPNNPHLN